MPSVDGPAQPQGLAQWLGWKSGVHALVPATSSHCFALFGPSSLASLEDLDWLPLNPATSRVSKMVLKVTISAVTFLQEHGVAATGAGGYLSRYSSISSGSLVKFIDNQWSSSAVQII